MFLLFLSFFCLYSFFFPLFFCFVLFVCLFVFSFFFLSLFFLILFCVLTLHLLILSSASLYFYLLLLPTIFFYVNAFKLHPSKQTSLNNIVYPRPAFIPGLSFCFTHFTVFVFVLFFFSYTFSVLCGYLTFEISNFPSSLERKSNLMPATCPRKDFDPKSEFVFLPCTRARQPPSRT